MLLASIVKFIAISILVLTLIIGFLSGVVPTLGDSWVSTSQWSQIWGHDTVRIVLLSIGITGFLLLLFSSIKINFFRKCIFSLIPIPLIYLALIPVDQISTESRLVNNLVALEQYRENLSTATDNRSGEAFSNPESFLINEKNKITKYSKIFSKYAPLRLIQESIDIQKNKQNLFQQNPKEVPDDSSAKTKLNKIKEKCSFEKIGEGLKRTNKMFRMVKSKDLIRFVKPIAKKCINKNAKSITKLKNIISNSKKIREENKKLEQDQKIALSGIHGTILSINKATEQANTLLWTRGFQLFLFLSLIIVILFYPSSTPYIFISIPITLLVIHIEKLLSFLPLIPNFIINSRTENLFFFIQSLSLIGISLITAAVALSWKQNSEFWSITLFFKAFIRWLPLGAGALAITFFFSLIDNQVLKQIYSIQPGKPKEELINIACSSNYEERLITRRDCKSLNAENLEVDIDRSVKQRMKLVEEVILEKLESGAIKGTKEAKLLPSIGTEIFDSSIPHKLGCGPGETAGNKCISHDFYGGYSCGWFSFSCRMKRSVKRGANKTYFTSRNDTKTWLQSRLTQIADETGDNIDKGHNDAEKAIKIATNILQIEIREGVWNSFRIWQLINLFSLMIFVIAVIKSLGYVFARLYFNENVSSVSFISKSYNNDSSPIDPSQITIGNNQKIRIHHKSRFWIRYSARPNGVTPKGIIPPQPFRLAFVRFFKFRYLMRYFDLNDKKPEAELTTIGSKEFIVIELKQGQSIFFNLKNLYGMSKGTKFISKFNFRLPTLFMGRIRYFGAAGPGTIILQTKGRPKHITPCSVTDGLSPKNLIAWTSYANITVESDKSLSSIYTGGVLLKSGSNTFAIFDADTGGGGFEGALKFLPMFLIPI